MARPIADQDITSLTVGLSAIGFLDTPPMNQNKTDLGVVNESQLLGFGIKSDGSMFDKMFEQCVTEAAFAAIESKREPEVPYLVLKLQTALGRVDFSSYERCYKKKCHLQGRYPISGVAQLGRWSATRDNGDRTQHPVLAKRKAKHGSVFDEPVGHVRILDR